MGVEFADADSDDSTDTVVASGELRSRWREQARRLHTTPEAVTEAAMSDEKSSAATREAAIGAPSPSVGTRREVKKELYSPDFPPGPSGDHRVTTVARSEKSSTVPERDGANGSRLTVNPGRPIKTEQPAVVAVAPFNVKLENAPAASTDVGVSREEVNPSLPANSINADVQRSVDLPMARPAANESSNALSGSDSDFDDPLSDDGSEMDGFDDFLEGISRELNDGQYSDLRDELVSSSPPPSQPSQAPDQVVKSEPRSPSRSSSTERLQPADAFNEMRHAVRSGAPEASAVPPQLSLDCVPLSDEMNALSNLHVGIAPAVVVLVSQQSVADSNIDSESSQRDAADQNTAQLSNSVDATNELSESTRNANKYSGTKGLVKSVSNIPVSDEPLEETTGLQPDDDKAREATGPCSSQETPLSSDQIPEERVLGALSAANQLVSDARPQVSSSVAASSGTASSCCGEALTAKDISESLQKSVGTTEKAVAVVDQKAEQRDLDRRDAEDIVGRQSSSLELGEHKTTEDIVKPQPRKTDANTIVHGHGMIDQSIQVNSLEGDSEGTSKGSSCPMAVSSLGEKERKMVDTNTQTDLPRSSAAALKAIADLQSSSWLPKPSGAMDDGSAKHIDDYCEKTFWLLENFSEGLAKEDDSHKTRSVLDSAKEVRDSLNKRHGLPLSHQLNLCTNAVRSMLNALRKLSKRSSRKAARKVQEIDTKEKPTEVVQPYTTVRDRLGSPPVESTRSPETRPSVHERLSYPHKTPARAPETNPNSVGDPGTSSANRYRPGSPSSSRVPSCRSGTDRMQGQEPPPKSLERKEDTDRQEMFPEQATNDSVWASRLLPKSRKRIVEDGYGLPFLDSLRDCQAVDAVFSTAFRRLIEKYHLVFENRVRLPETVQNRIPHSAKWREIRSKRLKSELFTGFGIFLEDVADLQSEFLPLNPFQINPLPQKKASIAGHDGANPQQGALHDSHTSGRVRHASEGVRHAPEGVRHAPEGVRHAPEGVRHPSGGVRHASGGVGHASGGAQRGTDVWEEQCQRFLEKIQYLEKPGGTPTTPDARQRNRSGQRAPSPAAFVNVYDTEVSNPVTYPLTFPPPTLANPRPPASRESGISAPDAPMVRCLIPIPSSTLDSTPTSSGVDVLAQRSVEPEDIDMSLSDGEDNITGWTPPDKSGGLRVLQATGGELTDESEPQRAQSRHTSGRASTTPPRSGGGGSRCPSARSVASLGDGETDAQQLAQRILQEGLDLLDRQRPVTPSSSAGTPASVKRRRRDSDKVSCEARKRSRRQSGVASQSKARLDELLCDEHGVIHDDPWETFLHLSTRPDDSSYVGCPLCDSVHAKTAILGHARTRHGVRKPGVEDSDGSPKSSAPDTPSRCVTGTERSRRRSPSEDSPRYHRTAKRSRYQSSSDETPRRRSGHRSSSRERPRRSSHLSSEDRWRRRAERRSTSLERSRGDWPPMRSRHRSASMESTRYFPTCDRGRRRSASVESTRFPDRSMRLHDPGSPSDYRGQWDGAPSAPRNNKPWWPVRSYRARFPSPTDRSRGYSPPDRRSGRLHDSERDAPRHHRGSDRPRRRTSGEGTRRQPSPDRTSRTRVKGESSRRRSRSPVGRPSRTASRRERLNTTTGETPLESDSNPPSSDASLQERKPCQPKEGVPKPRHRSPSSPLHKKPVTLKPVTLRVSESLAENDDHSTSSAHSGEVSARQLLFEQLFVPSAAKLRAHLADIESDSNTTEEKSPSTKPIQTASNQKATQQRTPARSLPIPAGFSKEELQRILSTIKAATSNAESKSSNAESKSSSTQQPTPKESCDPPTPDEETDYISFVNDDQCLDSSDEETSTCLQEDADVKKPPDAGSVGSHLTMLNTEPVKEERQPLPSCLVNAQPKDLQTQQDEQSLPEPAAKLPKPENDSQMSLPQPTEGRPKPLESYQDVPVGNSEPINEKLTETAALGHQEEGSNVSASESAEPPMAATVTATSKPDERTSQTRPVGHQPTQQVTKKLSSNPTLIEIQPKEVELQTEKAGEQVVETDSGKRQASTPSDESPDNQEAAPDSTDPKVFKLNCEKGGKQGVESESTERQALKPEENHTTNANEPHSSDVCTENKRQDNENDSKATPNVSVHAQPNVSELAEETQENGAPSSVEESNKIETKKIETKTIETKKIETKKIETKKIETKKIETKKIETKKIKTEKIATKKIETKSTQEQRNSEGTGGNTAPAKESKDGGLKPGVSATAPVKSVRVPRRCSLLCRVLFCSLLSLRNHEKVCAKGPPPCPTCHQKVTNLNIHRSKCNGLAPWLCPSCHKWSTDPRDQHSQHCPAQCARCGMIGVHVCPGTSTTPRSPAFAPRGASPRPRAASSPGRFRSRGASPIVQRFPRQRGGGVPSRRHTMSGARPFRPTGQRPASHHTPGPPCGDWIDREREPWCEPCGMWGHNCHQQGPEEHWRGSGPSGNEPEGYARGAWGGEEHWDAHQGPHSDEPEAYARGAWRGEEHWDAHQGPHGGEPEAYARGAWRGEEHWDAPPGPHGGGPEAHVRGAWRGEEHWDAHQGPHGGEPGAWGAPPGPHRGEPEVCGRCGTWGPHQCAAWRPVYKEGWNGGGF